MRNIRSDNAPAGFEYFRDVMTAAEESSLVAQFADLPFREFEFQGYLGKRRVVSFGWRYDFGDHSLHEAAELPHFLLPIRERASTAAGIESKKLVHALVTEYRPGTVIGWHRDRDVFGDVLGISLLSPCTFRLRHRLRDAWERYSQHLEPRSVYMIRGAARHEWEHSIPPVGDLRYSITFRTLKADETPVVTTTRDSEGQLYLDF